MAGTLNLTQFAYALKTVYDETKMLTAVAEKNVAYARMPKNFKFGGNNFAFGVIYAPMTGRSNLFATAQANKNPSKGKQFLLTRARDYAVGSIDTETLLASEGDEAALLTAMTDSADSALLALNRSLGIRTYGNGSGKVGVIDTPSHSYTLTLDTLTDAVNFEVGQKLKFAANEASSLRTGTLTVSAINRDAGTMTCAEYVDSVTSITDHDSIFVEGDYVTASDRKLPVGFGGWNPSTAPAASESFFGVDRSADTVSLGGGRYTSTTNPGLSTEEVIQLLASRVNKHSPFSPDTVYMGTDRFKDFIVAVGSKAIYQKVAVPVTNAKGDVVAELGFDSVRIHAGGSVLDCFADRNCPEATVFVQTLNTWEFKSMGPCPRWIVEARSMESEDAVEFRAAYWGNFRCKGPSGNSRYDF